MNVLKYNENLKLINFKHEVHLVYCRVEVVCIRAISVW